MFAPPKKAKTIIGYCTTEGSENRKMVLSSLNWGSDARPLTLGYLPGCQARQAQTLLGPTENLTEGTRALHQTHSGSMTHQALWHCSLTRMHALVDWLAV